MILGIEGRGSRGDECGKARAEFNHVDTGDDLHGNVSKKLVGDVWR